MVQNTEVGYVVSSRDFLVQLDGLPTIKVNDMVCSEKGERGWVNSLEKDQVEVLMVDDVQATPKQLFKKMPNRLSVSVGQFLLGRAINPLGVPIDGKGLLSKTKTSSVLELEQTALGIQSRQFITQQFATGITLIDSLVPLGKGQRELIMGDTHSGKTGFLIDLIVNQKNTGTICIYTLIGKSVTSVRDMIDILKANNALSYTVIIGASSTEPAPLIFLAPKTALTVAEYFQRQGRDVLLILDDLGTHAKIYREIALLGNKAPGRESYPGDIFYQHAHLLERAGNFKPEYGGGSITALPVIELNLTDFTTFIPTNLMAMTDGHLLFKSALRNLGQRPAVDISLSVSRVGRQTQDRLMNLVSDKIRQVLSQAQELETIARFAAELPFQTRLTISRKGLIEEILKQEPFTFIPKEIQTILLGLTLTTFAADKDRKFMEKYKQVLANAFVKDPQLSKITKSLTKLKTAQQLIDLLESVKAQLSKLCP